MAATSQFFPLLRRVAPRLTREFFSCRQCPRKSQIPRLTPWVQSNVLPRASCRKGLHTTATRRVAVAQDASSVSTRSADLTPVAPTTRASRFPEVSHRIVAYWLLGSAASVFGIVVFGGLTRLTESGYVLPRYALTDLIVNTLA